MENALNVSHSAPKLRVYLAIARVMRLLNPEVTVIKRKERKDKVRKRIYSTEYYK